jgi:hypothetical protein
MAERPQNDRGLFEALIGDGRPLIVFTGLTLILSGGFALFQSATGQFLPQDVQFLGMTAQDLCHINQCRIVHFIFHDRVSFGGAIIAVGLLYIWLAEFPLKASEPWAWWLLLLSGTIGFGSFLTYLGYHYLDTWHGLATLLLLPCFIAGLLLTCQVIRRGGPTSLLHPAVRIPLSSPFGAGRACLIATSAALIAGGIIIMAVGSTTVFVPQDIQFMGLSPTDLNSINPRLIPLIAHDRAGFGGGLCCTGITVFFCAWCGKPSRSLWQVIAAAGLTGFTTAIGIHPIIGYTSMSHLAPAIIAAALFVTGLVLTFRPMMSRGLGEESDSLTRSELAG